MSSNKKKSEIIPVKVTLLINVRADEDSDPESTEYFDIEVHGANGYGIESVAVQSVKRIEDEKPETNSKTEFPSLARSSNPKFAVN